MTDASDPSPRRLRNIAELARIAGVSAGTVSRALSGTGLISPVTRDRIRALAAAHDFTPNALARNLRIRRTGAIAVVIPLGHEVGQHLSDPFFMTMLGGLADALTERGYDLLLSRVIPKDDGWLDRIVDSGRVDGVLVIGQSDQAEALDRVAARYRPLVAWGGHRPGQRHCSVGSDNRHGGALAATHLIERGCRRIAFFGDPRALEFRQRLEGCRAALAAAGMAQDVIVFPAHLMAEEAHADVSAFLHRESARPDGIVAASDVVALATLRALALAGVAVPEDVRVVGHDDLPLARQALPPLTTVRQDFATGAAQLVSLLLRRIAGEETESVVMTPELVVRRSS
ncbi:LacI family DNA-binding transcriptional regulator [Sandaracinobacteroides saxicola]|uniref:Substrate-binding domain-containing protein n=1 Tax=Sandaracinobacteroides saxicola TaxID=2759707 RepID=A0A7G5IL29_9SPHN|nr:substrate-binding domain-containing protein [Sandaracinobacteroides saxicola]QMW24071.1 substrate-binding domain-containing protein [Sandaracinobacteroides saxicola]